MTPTGSPILLQNTDRGKFGSWFSDDSTWTKNHSPSKFLLCRLHRSVILSAASSIRISRISAAWSSGCMNGTHMASEVFETFLRRTFFWCPKQETEILSHLIGSWWILDTCHGTSNFQLVNELIFTIDSNRFSCTQGLHGQSDWASQWQTLVPTVATMKSVELNQPH